MPKKLEITPKILDWFTSATDGDVDVNTVSIYESESLNTLPVNKKNGLFENAVHPEGTLMEMAAYASARPLKAHIPVHVMHDTYTLPVGKVFHAEFLRQDGIPQVRSLFYISNTEPGLVGKVEDGSIAEVSVGLSYKNINCSQCGFDYMKASMEQIWDRTCENGHEIGVDGVHAVLNGIDQWMEQSLVGRGAAQNPKIYGRAKSLLASERYNQLSASGVDPRALTLFATATQPSPKENTMDLTVLIGELTTAKASVSTLTAQLAAATETASKLPALEAQVAALNAQIAALQAAEPAALQAKVVAAEATTAAALSVVRKEADRLCIAAGVAKLDEKADITALQASIDDNRTKLQATFGAVSTTLEQSSKPRVSAFRLTATN